MIAMSAQKEISKWQPKNLIKLATFPLRVVLGKSMNRFSVGNSWIHNSATSSQNSWRILFPSTIIWQLKQSHYTWVERWAMFMEQKLRFGLVLGLKKKFWPIMRNFWGRSFHVIMDKKMLSFKTFFLQMRAIFFKNLKSHNLKMIFLHMI